MDMNRQLTVGHWGRWLLQGLTILLKAAILVGWFLFIALLLTS
jgi:hypothetical protein